MRVGANMARKASSIFLMVAMLCLTSCRVEGELWVKNDGAGHGTLSFLDFPIISKVEIEKELAKHFEVISVTEKDRGITAEVNWSDFNKPFATRRQNNDGLIILNFGDISVRLSYSQ
jgi:hypothetical protein